MGGQKKKSFCGELLVQLISRRAHHQQASFCCPTQAWAAAEAFVYADARQSVRMPVHSSRYCLDPSFAAFPHDACSASNYGTGFFCVIRHIACTASAKGWLPNKSSVKRARAASALLAITRRAQAALDFSVSLARAKSLLG